MSASPPPPPANPAHSVIYFSPQPPPSGLSKLLVTLGITLVRAQDAESLGQALATGANCDVIVPCNEGVISANHFAETCLKTLMPEDRDTGVVYVNPGPTPADWTKRGGDPRPFGDPNFHSATYFDPDYSQAVAIVAIWGKRARRSHCPGRTPVEIILEKGLILEEPHTRIIRAAFRGCESVRISQAKAGKTGAVILRASGRVFGGGNLKDYILKLFDNVDGGLETSLATSNVYMMLRSSDIRPPEPMLQVSGEGRSLHGSEFVLGPGGGIVTLAELISKEPQTALAIMKRLRKVLTPLFQSASRENHGLARLYLEHDRAHHVERLQSELRELAWPGISDQADPRAAMYEWLNALGCRASVLGRVHGDLHGDNVVIYDDGGQLRPVLIDFANTARAHAATDLAALAADTVTRAVVEREGIQGISKAVGILCEGAKPGTQLEHFLAEIRESAIQELSCSSLEFTGSVLCRALWVLPRIRSDDERAAFRRLILELRGALERQGKLTG